MKILSMPAGAAGIPENLTGHITNNTYTGWSLQDAQNTYNPVDDGGGYNHVTVPGVLTMTYVGSNQFRVLSSYNCTFGSTSPSQSVNIIAGTASVITLYNGTDVSFTF